MNESDLKEKQAEIEAREKAILDREAEVSTREQAANEKMAQGTKQRMVKPLPKNSKMVKVKCVLPFRFTTPEGKRDAASPGEIVDVAASEAKELVENITIGHYDFSGERYEADGDVKNHKFQRAEYATETTQPARAAV